jgi:dimethylargininase
VKALVRVPSPRLAEGLLTHIDRQSVDYDRARRQWDGYVAALESVGWHPVEVAPAPEHPDSVFIEDAVVVHGHQAMVTRPGAAQRRGETAGAATAVEELGLEMSTIEGPDTLDGGDVLKIGDRWYVGVGDRSTVGACEQLARYFGVEVVPVPTTKALHLKSAVTALPDGTVIGYPPLVDDAGAFKRFLAVPEEPGSHVVVVDDDTVLMATSAPRTAQALQDRGLRTVQVDIGEFEKLEGCVTCLSVRVR